MKPTKPSKASGPELLKEVLSRLFAARGWGRRQGRLHIETAWTEAVGPEMEPHTRVLRLRKGVLEIEVDNGVLLQELAHYHKRRLLEQIRSRLTGQIINDMRFRAGGLEIMSVARAYEELVHFITAGSTPKEVIGFHPSDAARTKVGELIRREKTAGLTAEETAELNHYMQLEHVMRLAKARAQTHLPRT